MRLALFVLNNRKGILWFIRPLHLENPAGTNEDQTGVGKQPASLNLCEV